MDQIKEIINKKTLPGLIVIIVLLAGIAAAVFLAQQRTRFLPRALTTNTISVPATIRSTDGVWNVLIDANTSNGGKVYYLNDSACNSVAACMARPKPFEGWTEIRTVGSGNTFGISWSPSVSSVSEGVHTFALFSADGGTILDVKTANFSAETASGTATISLPTTVTGTGGTWNVIIDVTTSNGGKVYFLNGAPCNSINECMARPNPFEGWTEIRTVSSGSSTFNWNPQVSVVPAGTHTFAVFNTAGDKILAVKTTNFFSGSTGGGTGTIRVPATVTSSAQVWNLVIDVTTSNGGILYYLNDTPCSSVATCKARPNPFEGWTEIRKVNSGSLSVNWNPPISNVAPGIHTIALFNSAGDNILDVKTTNFVGATSGTGTISVNDPVRTTGNVWNVVIDTNTSNGGIIYFQNGAPCNSVTECFSKYGYDGWTRVPNNTATVPAGTRTTSWAPPISNIPAGVHTFGLFSADEKTLLAIDNTTFTAPSGGTVSDSALCKSPGPIFYEEGTTTKAAFVQAGKTYDVVITMENKNPNTSIPLSTWDKDEYGLGFPTANDKGADTNNFNQNNYPEYWDLKFPSPSFLRLTLANDVAPNGAYDFKIKATAKKAGNNVPFVWRMVHEDVAWFGGECLTQIDINPASTQPSPSPDTEFTQCFAIGENEQQVKAVTNCNDKTKVFEYPSHPTTLPYVISDTTPGAKTIYVRFISNKGNVKDINKQIIYSPNPTISNISCTKAASGTGTTILVKGSNFGTHVSQGPSSVKAANKNASINSWTNDTISSTVSDNLTGSIPVEVKIDDGRVVSGTCEIGVNALEFSIKPVCSRIGDYTDQELDIEIIEVDQNRSVLKRKAKVNSAGKVQDLKPNLVTGRKYHFAASTPYSLVTKVEFTVADGTTVVPDVNLRIGDIYKDKPISKINAFDVTDLYTQWSVDKDVTKLGDFNNDKRVNGFDYSCMIKSYNQEDDK